MKAYTCQFGRETSDSVLSPSHSETIYADSLDEAIDKAKALTHIRPVKPDEVVVRVVENADDEYPLWASSVEDVRGGKFTMADPD